MSARHELGPGQIAARARNPRLECNASGCLETTRKQKRFCPGHLRFNGYASRFFELEQIKTIGARAVDPDGSLAREIFDLAVKDGALGMKDAAEFLEVPRSAVACYFSALQTAGVVAIEMDEFGVCIRPLEDDERAQAPILPPEPIARAPLEPLRGAKRSRPGIRTAAPKEKDMGKANSWGHAITEEEFGDLFAGHSLNAQAIADEVGASRSSVDNWSKGRATPSKKAQVELFKLLQRLEGDAAPIAALEAVDVDEDGLEGETPFVVVQAEEEELVHNVTEDSETWLKRRPSVESVGAPGWPLVESPLDEPTDAELPLLAIAGRRAARWLRGIAGRLEARATGWRS